MQVFMTKGRRSTFTASRALMAIIASTAGTLLAAQSIPNRAVVPVRELSQPTTAGPTFSNILNVRQVANGHVLVNDALRRQLILLDNKLAIASVVLDSVTQGGREGYGPQPSTIIPYLADSTFFVDRSARTLLLIDPAGHVVRSVAAPVGAREFSALSASACRVDGAGNLLFRAVTGTPSKRIGDTTSRVIVEESRQPDSTYILRANFELRVTDTVARLKQVGAMRSIRTRAPDVPPSIRLLMSPLETLDDWTTLADGTIAVVRGGDYHVDFFRQHGKWQSSAKLPFDWRPLTDADKQHLVDSTRAYVDEAARKAEAVGGSAAALDAERDALIGSMVSLPGAAPTLSQKPQNVSGGSQTKVSLIPYDFVPFDEMPSYYPPLRMGFTQGDADGNLWILPATSAQSKKGELVYDVVNGAGVLFERVRLPLGRAVAGFGAGGIVYLTSRDASGLWHLERSRVIR